MITAIKRPAASSASRICAVGIGVVLPFALVSGAAEPSARNASANPVLTVRTAVQQALQEKLAEKRLQRFMEAGAKLSEQEIPGALEADALKELQRDQLILGYVEVAVMWAPNVVAKQALLIAEPMHARGQCSSA